MANFRHSTFWPKIGSSGFLLTCNTDVPWLRFQYGITELETYAAVFGVEHFAVFLLGQRFELITDHTALKTLKDSPKAPNRVLRWFLRLAQYDFDVVYRPGRKHGNADALSRMAADAVEVKVKENPSDSWREIARLQAEDPELGLVIRYLQSGQWPQDADSKRKVRRAAACGHLKNGVLLRLELASIGANDAKIWLPAALKQEVLEISRKFSVAVRRCDVVVIVYVGSLLLSRAAKGLNSRINGHNFFD